MNKVKYYRLISGLLLKDLSEKTGLSVGHLSHIENGNKQPSKSAMESIALAVGSTVPEVFYTPLTAEEKEEMEHLGKAREPKVFRSMDDLPLMLTPYDLMDFLGKGQRQTYELIHSEGFPYVQDGPKIKIPKWLLIEFINEKVRKGEPL